MEEFFFSIKKYQPFLFAFDSAALSSSLSLGDSVSSFPLCFFVPVRSFLDYTAARASSAPLAMLDTSQIQQIQRIKNIITCISLENMGEMQVDVRQRPGYKAWIL